MRPDLASRCAAWVLAAAALGGCATMVPESKSPARPTTAFPSTWDTQPPLAPPTKPPEGQSTNDAVVMLDGSRVEGHVQKSEPGQFVIIECTDGTTRTLAWSGIKEVVQGSAPKPPSEPKPCAQPAPDGSCGGETPSGSGQGWTAVLLSRDRLERVVTPPSTAVDGSFDAMLTYGTMKGQGGMGSTTLVMAGGNLGVKILAGGKLPGPDGGSWSGLGLEPTVGFQGGVISAEAVSGSVLAMSGGGNIGYQYLHFGKLDDTSLRQSGFGLFLGYHAGLQYTKTSMTIILPAPIYSITAKNSNTDFSHGPVLGVSFPRYNAGTAKLRRIYINAMLLPTGDFIFASLMGGATF